MFKDSWHFTETVKGFPKHAEGHDRRNRRESQKKLLKDLFLKIKNKNCHLHVSCMSLQLKSLKVNQHLQLLLEGLG